MGYTLSIHRADSINKELEQMDARIRWRAYELFLEDRFPGRELDNWLVAEGELAWHPLIELRETYAEFVLSMAVPGLDPRAIQVSVTAEDILVTATRRPRREPEAAVHAAELNFGDLFRAVHLPRRIDRDSVRAKVENGMLQLSADIAWDWSESMPDSGRLVASAAA